MIKKKIRNLLIINNHKIRYGQQSPIKLFENKSGRWKNLIDLNLLKPTQLLYESIGKPFIKTAKEIENLVNCPLCGTETNEIVDWKIGNKFTDLDMFAEKENIKFLCVACFFTLKHIRDLHKPYILTGNSGSTVIQYDDQPDRKISIDSKTIVTRYFLKEFLLNTPVDDPWILMLQSKMNPQHSLIRAMVNYENSEIFWESDGIVPYAIPREGLDELLSSLEKIKRSDSLYPYLFSDRFPKRNHKEIKLWKEIESTIIKHKYRHYLPFLYDRVIPPKSYIMDS